LIVFLSKYDANLSMPDSESDFLGAFWIYGHHERNALLRAGWVALLLGQKENVLQDRASPKVSASFLNRGNNINAASGFKKLELLFRLINRY
jgi:hypothetical protein